MLAKNVEDLNTQLFRPSSQMLTSAQSKNRKKVAAFGSGAGQETLSIKFPQSTKHGDAQGRISVQDHEINAGK